MENENDNEKAYELLRLKCRLETNIGILDSEGDIRRSDGKMVSERIRELQTELQDLESGQCHECGLPLSDPSHDCAAYLQDPQDESRQEAEDYLGDDPYSGWSLRDAGRNDDGSGESYAERNA